MPTLCSKSILFVLLTIPLLSSYGVAAESESQSTVASTVLTSPRPQPVGITVLDGRAVLQAQTFWDNRDWVWYERNIPLLETPDHDIDMTWYYRWELLTKHLTYGSPDHGYTFTEFIDRPFWSGTYGSISCPAGLQLYEARWLRDPQIARDFSRYWFRVPGAQPRRYSTWLADAIWSFHLVNPDEHFVVDLLPDLKANYEIWRRDHFDEDVGMFWQHGMADGMETNISSRQTVNEFSGAEGYRPTLNTYLWADAHAIARIAALARDDLTAADYRRQAGKLKAKLQNQLWDSQRRFFFPMTRRDEAKDGYLIKARTLTYETGRYAGSPHGRELIGYVPWQFSLPDARHGFEQAWQVLFDSNYFQAPFGPTTVERNDPQFLISSTCCVWSGQSWPYATTQTLKGLANVLQQYEPEGIDKQDYWNLLRTYAKTHRKGGWPYIAEAVHPDSGSWSGHDHYNHSEHYFHSGYADLVITGLIGLTPRDDDMLELAPLAPEQWDYFALDNVVYRGHQLAVIWDRTGIRYGRGAGFQLFVDGQSVARRPHLERLTHPLPSAAPAEAIPLPLNYAVNNSLHYFPHATASYTSEHSAIQSVHDGNYWYHRSPPNRWTTEDSPNSQDWCEIDFGMPRRIHTVKLYFLDDDQTAPIDYQPIDTDANTPPRPTAADASIAPPASYELLYAASDTSPWLAVPKQFREPAIPLGRQANAIEFPDIHAQRVRVVLTHATAKRSGLTEFEVWGNGQIPVEPASPPPGNLAANPRGEGYPRASCSWISRFDRSVSMVNDGLINFRPEPMNRWTSYESPYATDWLAIDFGKITRVGRVELYVFDDHGGVQAPKDYRIEIWSNDQWKPVPDPSRDPAQPIGSRINTVTFPAQSTSKLRVVFMHRSPSRSGLTEIAVWEK